MVPESIQRAKRSVFGLADTHDGLYLGGTDYRFHHNRIEALQDDGLYLSPMYLRHRPEKTDPQFTFT